MAGRLSSLVLAVCAGTTLGSKEECVAERDEAVSMRLELLQHQAHWPSLPLLSRTAKNERLDRAKPIAWMHVPKTGTSFADTIYHMRGICPNFNKDSFVQPYGIPWDPEWGTKEEICPGGFSDSYAAYLHTDLTLPVTSLIHEGLGSAYDANKGHLVTMLRQPEQRIISGYYRGGREDSVQIMWPYDTPAANVREYAEVAAGCAVRTIMRDGANVCGDPLPVVTQDEVSGAVSRLREGFAFVGITDEWDLSICLWHAMFGGSCQDFEFYNTRMGPHHSNDTMLYDTAELEGFLDTFDGSLFDEAQSIYQENLEYFQVDTKSCLTCQWLGF